MARKRYTAEEIIGHLRTIEIETGKGFGIAEVCRKLGITEQNCGMNCSTANSPTRCRRRGSSWKVGANATIRTAHIVRWGIGHLPQKLVPSHRLACRREGT
jgi:hypothetical protein